MSHVWKVSTESKELLTTFWLKASQSSHDYQDLCSRLTAGMKATPKKITRISYSEGTVEGKVVLW